MKPLSRHAARAVAVVTSVALAGTTAVVLAPSASAYYGSETTVRNALLPTSTMLKTGGWNMAKPIAANILRDEAYSWVNIVPPTPALTPTEILPEYTQLIVEDDTSARDRRLGAFLQHMRETSTKVYVRTNGVWTFDKLYEDNGDGTSIVESVSLVRAGSDGFAVAGCLAPSDTTTTTADQRAVCSRAVATLQATKWEAVSPSFTRKTSAKVRSTLLTGKQARKAAKFPKGVGIKAGGSHREEVELSGVEYWKSYTATGSKAARKKKVSIPYFSSITEYGNRTNAKVAFAQWKAADKKAGKLHDVTSTRYTVSFTVKSGGKKVKTSVTVALYTGVIVSAGCVANRKNQPKASSVRSCSKRLAAAQVTKAKPVFRSVK